ncbi:hypothetical protein [Streptomyces nanshensis]|uniref:Uncharacterized protein n=1 Tax=Streptomyces nanshensis TaxID=518642 RepID=A0A1E7L573_9ACTN|nr:hypothetical protein [Streptomyces nanshensis]OEV11347.1 hypothetical protein AN218_13445 [Streptomyces nanshensis]
MAPTSPHRRRPTPDSAELTAEQQALRTAEDVLGRQRCPEAIAASLRRLALAPPNCPLRGGQQGPSRTAAAHVAAAGT